MRDPKRIKQICNKLQDLWERYPDMRFTQLLTNFVYTDGKLFWSQEDDFIIEQLNEITRRANK